MYGSLSPPVNCCVWKWALFYLIITKHFRILCPGKLCAFPLQWLVLHVRDLLSFLSSLPPLNRMVVFQIYLQFKLQKRNLDPLVCKPCIKDSFILGVTCTFSWIMLLSINDKWSTCTVVGGLP